MNAATIIMVSATVFAMLGACGGSSVHPKTPIAVKDAALPYSIVRADGGGQISEQEFAEALRGAEVVCIGEDHPNPHHHWAQLQMLSTLAGDSDRHRAMGLEMVQRPFQGVLNQFRDNEIHLRGLEMRSEWEKRWGYDFALYEPLFVAAHDAGWDVVALNISKELKDRYKTMQLGPQDQPSFPVIKHHPEHRAWFEELMRGMMAEHGVKDPKKAKELIQNMYVVQELWDEVMADTTTKWLTAHTGGAMAIIAGNGHCHRTAIPARIRRRGEWKIVSVRPVVNSGKGEATALVAEPSVDYLFVMTAPKGRK